MSIPDRYPRYFIDPGSHMYAARARVQTVKKSEAETREREDEKQALRSDVLFLETKTRITCASFARIFVFFFFPLCFFYTLRLKR